MSSPLRDDDLPFGCPCPSDDPAEGVDGLHDIDGEDIDDLDDDGEDRDDGTEDGLDEEEITSAWHTDENNVGDGDGREYSDEDEDYPYPSPRILVVDQRAKLHGRHFGEWIEAAKSEATLEEEVGQLLQSSPYGGERWQIERQEGFGDLQLGPHPSLKDVSTLATNIAKHGPLFVALAERFGGFSGIDHAAEVMEVDFEGDYASRGAWAKERAGLDGRDARGAWSKHVDWDALTREEEKDKRIFVIELGGRVYVFRQ